MYKILVFLEKTDDPIIIEHFKKFTTKLFSVLCGKELNIGKVEANPLLENKFSFFFEIEFDSKEKWEQLLSSQTGKELGRDLTDFHKHITVIFIDYEHISN